MQTTSIKYASVDFNFRLKRALIHSKILDINEINDYSDKSKQDNMPLAEILLKDEIISENKLLNLIALDGNVTPVDLTIIESIDPEVLSLITRDDAIKNCAIPLAILGETLTVACDDPFSTERRETLEIRTKRKIRFVLSKEAEIIDTISKFYKAEKKTVKKEKPGKEKEKQKEKENKNQKVKAEKIANEDFNFLLREAQVKANAKKAKAQQEEKIQKDVDGGVIRLANRIVVDAFNQGASDIHIEPYMGDEETVIRFRVDGDCRIYERIPNQLKRALLTRLKIMCDLDIAERRLPQDGKIKFSKYGPLDIELRVATIPTINGNEDAVLRILAASEPLPIEKMGFQERNVAEFKRMVQIPYGLILVVGPTGSGKTTTLHSALGFINEDSRKIWTAEDPVEITQKGLRQVQVLPKIGFTFAAAMRSFLRADPDVIMVGEMRDKETASMGIEASLTGHLVFSTLHTNSAPETVTRLIDMGLDPFNFADAMLGIMAQRLTRRICSKCHQEEPMTEERYMKIREEFDVEIFDKLSQGPEAILPTLDEAVFHEGKGCDACNGSGTRGRIGIHELLVGTDAIKELIQNKSTAEVLRDRAIQEGMTTLKQDGFIKAFNGQTSFKQVRGVCIK